MIPISITDHGRDPSNRVTSGKAMFLEGNVFHVSFSGDNGDPLLSIDHSIPDLWDRSHSLLYLATTEGRFFAASYQLMPPSPIVSQYAIFAPHLAALLRSAQPPAFPWALNGKITLPYGTGSLVGLGGFLGDIFDINQQLAALELQIKEKERDIIAWQFAYGASIVTAFGSGMAFGASGAKNPVAGVVLLGALAAIAGTTRRLGVAEAELRELLRKWEELTIGKERDRDRGHTSTSDQPGGTQPKSGSPQQPSSSDQQSASSESGSRKDLPVSEPPESKETCSNSEHSNGDSTVICKPSDEDDDHSDDAFPDPDSTDPGNPRSYAWTIVGMAQLPYRFTANTVLSAKLSPRQMGR